MYQVEAHTPQELRSLGDAALIDAIAVSARAAAAVEAHHLAAIAELTRRRLGAEQHPSWGCDDWDAAAAEISCALTVKHGRAMSLMERAIALAEVLPKVGALFLAGQITALTAMSVVSRTRLVNDPAARAQVDSAIAAKVTGWGPLSKQKLEAALDTVVAAIDPDAKYRSRSTVAGREINIGDPRADGTDLRTIWGRLSVADAALLDEALNAMARGVCEDDPRTLAQRRADAMGALAAHLDHLACACEDPDCSAKTGGHPATRVVIHVVTNAAVAPAKTRTTAQAGESPEPEVAAPEVAAPEVAEGPGSHPASPAPSPPQEPSPVPVAFIAGRVGGLISTEALAALIALGATVRTVTTPKQGLQPRYRPSTALDEFIRTRDLTCRFPGCDKPAVRADIDHGHPWGDGGHTHPSSLLTRCRLHHLLKTFWDGWSETQHPDGTLDITTPTGHTYTTKPFASVMFPGWDTNTGVAPPPGKPRRKRGPGHTLMMPTRKHPRVQTRARRVERERALNHAALDAEEAAARAAAVAANRPPPPGRNDPPPF